MPLCARADEARLDELDQDGGMAQGKTVHRQLYTTLHQLSIAHGMHCAADDAPVGTDDEGGNEAVAAPLAPAGPALKNPFAFDDKISSRRSTINKLRDHDATLPKYLKRLAPTVNCQLSRTDPNADHNKQHESDPASLPRSLRYCKSLKEKDETVNVNLIVCVYVWCNVWPSSRAPANPQAPVQTSVYATQKSCIAQLGHNGAVLRTVMRSRASQAAQGCPQQARDPAYAPQRAHARHMFAMTAH